MFYNVLLLTTEDKLVVVDWYARLWKDFTWKSNKQKQKLHIKL